MYAQRPALRQGIRALLEADQGYLIVGETSDQSQALALARDQQPDMLILGILPTGVRDLALLHQVEEVSPRTRVVLLSMYLAPERSARRARPRRPTSAPLDLWTRALLRSLRRSGLGRAPDSPLVVKGSPKPLPPPPPIHQAPNPLDRLTPREREVFRLAAEGLSSNETGRNLGISGRTVECHRSHVMRKLGLHRRAELVRYAVETGILGPSRNPTSEV